MKYNLMPETEIVFLGDWIKNAVMLNGMVKTLALKDCLN